MNVVLLASCPTSALYLDALVAAGAPPRLVVTSTKTLATAPLIAACERAGVPVDRRDDVNATAATFWPKVSREPSRTELRHTK